jgi:hypothetical protein
VTHSNSKGPAETMPDLASKARAVLIEACRRTGHDSSGAELLRLRSNAVFKLREPIVVRITASASAPARLPIVLEMTRWLASQGFPTVRPANTVDQPLFFGDTTITFWEYVPTGDPPARTTDLGVLLRRLHALPEPPLKLGAFDDPLKSIRYDVHNRPGILDQTEQAWLIDRISELDQEWESLPFESRPRILHGDAWIDNLLRHPDGHTILCDWDAVSQGPREWDLIHSYHGERRFGLTSPDVEDFARAYAYDLRDWAGYKTLMEIRDLYAIGIHIRNAPGDPFSYRELRHRLDSLKDLDTTRQWHLRS